MRKDMLRAELLNNQLEQLEEQLEQLEQQRIEVQQLQQALDDFTGMNAGDELMVSLATGIFARATFTGDNDLLVNVGGGTMVRKTPIEIHEDLDAQLRDMDDAEKQMQSEFDRKIKELEELQERFKDVR